MDYLMELFGGIPVNGLTVATVLLLIGAGVSLYKTYSKFKKTIVDNAMEAAQRDKKIEETFQEVKKYHEYRVHDREQSFEIQKQLTQSLNELKESTKEHTAHLKQLDERVLSYELADTRDKLMQNFRYFTSTYHNPMQAWTELEYEAFTELMKTYEDRGGNGYMHTVVKPAMEALRVIPMTQLEDIAELMHNRK